MGGVTKRSKKLTRKQEAFAQLYVEIGNAAAAYRIAYGVSPEARDHWVYVEASRMLGHPVIALRIKNLQRKAATQHRFTVARASEEYEEARRKAMKTGNPSAAVSAVAGKVRLFGLDKPIRTELAGNGSVELAVSPSDRLRAFLENKRSA